MPEIVGHDPSHVAFGDYPHSCKEYRWEQTEEHLYNTSPGSGGLSSSDTHTFARVPGISQLLFEGIPIRVARPGWRQGRRRKAREAVPLFLGNAVAQSSRTRRED